MLKGLRRSRVCGAYFVPKRRGAGPPTGSRWKWLTQTASRFAQSSPSSAMRWTAGPLQSSRRGPPSASTQCADADLRGCGTEVPEPSTVNLIKFRAFRGKRGKAIKPYGGRQKEVDKRQ